MSHIQSVWSSDNGEHESLSRANSYRILGKQQSVPDPRPAFIILYGTGKYTWQDQVDVFPSQSSRGNREEEVTERRLFAHCKKVEAESEGLLQKTGRRWLLSSEGIGELKGKEISDMI